MTVYLEGQIIEVGYNEYDEFDDLEDGGSYFIRVDVEEITEEEIVQRLNTDKTLVYIQLATTEQNKLWASENEPLSKWMKNK